MIASTHKEANDNNGGDSEDDGFNGLFEEVVEHRFYFEKILLHNSNVGCQVLFSFSLDHETFFESKLAFPRPLHGDSQHAILQCIGMCHLLWYWMGFATPVIEIRSFVLTDAAKSFWETFYNEVLLEFKFMHPVAGDVTLFQESKGCGIEIVEKELFEYNDLPQYRPASAAPHSNRQKILCPLGGGKDSLVVWQMACEQCVNKEDVALMYCCDTMYEYESNWRIQKLAEMTGSELHLVRHDFRSDSFEKYALSYLYPCGHPWAALVLFDSLLVCSEYGFEEVWLGFERSADEGNGVFWKGREVNHQYDKSSMFLQTVNMFLTNELKITTKVRSALSKTWELEIAKTFCQHPSLKPFHSVFLSCNEPVGHSNWCLKCEKCCFLFLLMSAWLPPKEVVAIFHNEQLFAKEALLSTFLKLVGANNQMKAFECVGTFAEASAAVELSLLQYYRQQQQQQQQEGIEVPCNLKQLCDFLNLDTSVNQQTKSGTATTEKEEEEIILRKWNEVHI